MVNLHLRAFFSFSLKHRSYLRRKAVFWVCLSPPWLFPRFWNDWGWPSEKEGSFAQRISNLLFALLKASLKQTNKAFGRKPVTEYSAIHFPWVKADRGFHLFWKGFYPSKKDLIWHCWSKAWGKAKEGSIFLVHHFWCGETGVRNWVNCCRALSIILLFWWVNQCIGFCENSRLLPFKKH